MLPAGPEVQAAPIGSRIRPAPPAALATVRVEREGLMDAFVCVDSDRDRRSPHFAAGSHRRRESLETIKTSNPAARTSTATQYTGTAAPTRATRRRRRHTTCPRSLYHSLGESDRVWSCLRFYSTFCASLTGGSAMVYASPFGPVPVRCATAAMGRSHRSLSRDRRRPAFGHVPSLMCIEAWVNDGRSIH